eukprot:jgi/Bigna1/91618/estExt_fgenesh1_pg.C_1090027
MRIYKNATTATKAAFGQVLLQLINGSNDVNNNSIINKNNNQSTGSCGHSSSSSSSSSMVAAVFAAATTKGEGGVRVVVFLTSILLLFIFCSTLFLSELITTHHCHNHHHYHHHHHHHSYQHPALMRQRNVLLQLGSPPSSSPWTDFAGLEPRRLSHLTPPASAAIASELDNSKLLKKGARREGRGRERERNLVDSASTGGNLEALTKQLVEDQIRLERTPALSQEFREFWRRGVKTLFSHWEIPQLAIGHRTAGPRTEAYVNSLQEDIVSLFLKRKTIPNIDYVEDLLFQRCDDDLNVQAEDHSPRMLAHDLILLYSQLVQNNTSMYNQLLTLHVQERQPVQVTEHVFCDEFISEEGENVSQHPESDIDIDNQQTNTEEETEHILDSQDCHNEEKKGGNDSREKDVDMVFGY